MNTEMGIHRMELRPCMKELWVVERYEGVKDCKYAPNTGYDRCIICMKDLSHGCPIDLCINSTYVWQGDLLWYRVGIHVLCRDKYADEPYRPFTTRDSSKQHYLLVSRSSQVLLLLEELGLPRDVAWLIAGVACWLL